MGISELGPAAIGALVGILAALHLHPTYTDKTVSAERRVKLLRDVLLIIGPPGGMALYSTQLAGWYGIGLLIGFIVAFVYLELNRLGHIRKVDSVVQRAKRRPKTTRRVLKDPTALDDPTIQKDLKDLLDDLGSDDPVDEKNGDPPVA